MKKKMRFVVLAIVIILLASFCCIFIFGKDKTENVFDQLYNEVKSVKKANDSILLTGTETAYADYDLGHFENIQIPYLDMCIDFDNKSLYLLFFNHNETEKWNISFCVLYRYDIHNKKLYGEQSLDYLNDNFLSHYFGWCKDANAASPYSLQELGDYTFILQETVNYN